MAEKTVIIHSGILGQKWGVRRYQNSDGTYTEEGKRRRREYSDDYKKYENTRKKSIKEMSNKELQDANNRYNLERIYKENNRSAGRKFVDRFVNKLEDKTAEKLATALVIAGTAVAVKYKDQIISSVKNLRKAGIH